MLQSNDLLWFHVFLCFVEFFQGCGFLKSRTDKEALNSRNPKKLGKKVYQNEYITCV